MSLIPFVGAAQKFNRSPDQYRIERSLRFRSSASAYLNRTPASAGNRKTWTWSAWVKRGRLGTEQGIFYRVTNLGNDTNSLGIQFDSTDVLAVTGYNTVWRRTTAVYRDSSAWYHIVVALDTTQATANNRVRVYVNGIEVTAFSTLNNPTQNADLGVNDTTQHSLGSEQPYTSGRELDGYLTEINFVDGQALTPSSFGETDALTGVWKPKKYAGTYGTNGFYLDFSDNSSLSNLTADKSGNNNNWTPNNISLISGATFDSMIDTPTPYADGGNGRGNYATLNPLSPTPRGTLSNGNLQFTGATDWGGSKSTFSIPSTGKWYAEFRLGATSSNSAQADVGIWPDGNSNGYAWAGSYGLEVNNGFFLLTNGSYSSDRGGTTAAGSVFQIAVDADAGTVWFGVNNAWYNTFNTTNGNPSAGTNPSGSSINFSATQFFMGVKTDFNNWAANFGQRPFAYTPPTGFKALNTQNLPEPVIAKGGEYFNTITWSGDNTSPRAISGVGFQPDWVWIKCRSDSAGHVLFDAVRGTGKNLSSSNASAEVTNSDFGYLSAFNSDGFSLTAGTFSGFESGNVNMTGRTYVGWNWKANGAGVTNTAGSITSTVSANPTAGFSIVTYTGTGANATVGHGLGVAPKMVIVKRRSGTDGWAVFTTMTSDGYMFLNSTSGKATGGAATLFGNGSTTVSPTSTVFSIATDSSLNASVSTYVAYCFSEVEGYSRFGSYTGNGSADGPFVFCGFRPAFVLIKRTDAVEPWNIYDNRRLGYNPASKGLYPNASDAENDASGRYKDLVSNGFKIRGTSGEQNASGGTYIFAAFSEAAFKYALAR
jgi:hypothetical protein